VGKLGEFGFMKTRKNQFVHYYPGISDFGLRAKQELKRAERYACFLSLLNLNLDSLLSTIKKREKFTNGDYESALNKIREFVCGCLRETDIISGIESNRMMILLAETPYEGARRLSDRISNNLSDFISGSYDFSFRFDIPVEIASFPHTEKTPLKLAEAIEALIVD
jgi:GGDEF domain-containing protein